MANKRIYLCLAHKQVDLVKARKYRKLCFCFFKKTGQMLPAVADYTCVLLAGLASKEIAEAGRHTCYDEAEKMIWRLAMRHIRKAQATPLANLLNRAYSQHVSVHDIGETARTVIPVVRNARYNNFLGAWDSAEFKDMVSGAGQQSRDYDLEDTWPAFSLQQNETSITR